MIQRRHYIILAVAGILIIVPFVVALACQQTPDSVRFIWLLASYAFYFLWCTSIGAAANPRPNAKRPDIHIARRMVNAAIGFTSFLLVLLIAGIVCMFGSSYLTVIATVFLYLIMTLGLRVGWFYNCPEFFR